LCTIKALFNNSFATSKGIVIKYFIYTLILAIFGYACYFFLTDQRAVFDRPALAEIELFDGPHLIYQDNQIQQINAHN
jgi:hypothetical protein